MRGGEREREREGEWVTERGESRDPNLRHTRSIYVFIF